MTLMFIPGSPNIETIIENSPWKLITKNEKNWDIKIMIEKWKWYSITIIPSETIKYCTQEKLKNLLLNKP